MAFKDNREFIEALERSGDVVRIRQEVSWDLEAGAIMRRSNELRGPAVFCEKIKDYPKGYRIFGIPLSTKRRIAIAMGIAPDTPLPTLQEEYASRLRNRIKPVVVEEAPCKENVILGDQVDLYNFPAPMIHDGDGGRYIGSWHMIVSQDPDSEWSNWGMYRLMIAGRRHLAGLCEPNTHLWRIRENWAARFGREVNMPISIAIGADPLSSLVSATRFGLKSEADYAGALRQEPVELIRCETNDLLVPAYAEIVLEGELLAETRIAEGPFGEFPGYRSAPREPRVAYQINAITHRNDPILTMSCMGIPVDDSQMIGAFVRGIAYKTLLKRAGIPVTNVYVPPEVADFMVIVGVKTAYCEYSNIASKVENLIAASPTMASKVIVVDEDVDVFNLGEVLHAFATKCHPTRGIRLTDREVAGTNLAPYLSPEERKWLKGARALFDCTWPLEWPRETAVPPKMSFNEAYPKEVKEKVLQNWTSYGFK
jgi:4-hydroxy-3-polyprenylbenzoate decarboxylase